MDEAVPYARTNGCGCDARGGCRLERHTCVHGVADGQQAALRCIHDPGVLPQSFQACAAAGQRLLQERPLSSRADHLAGSVHKAAQQDVHILGELPGWRSFCVCCQGCTSQVICLHNQQPPEDQGHAEGAVGGHVSVAHLQYDRRHQQQAGCRSEQICLQTGVAHPRMQHAHDSAGSLHYTARSHTGDRTFCQACHRGVSALPSSAPPLAAGGAAAGLPDALRCWGSDASAGRPRWAACSCMSWDGAQQRARATALAVSQSEWQLVQKLSCACCTRLGLEKRPWPAPACKAMVCHTPVLAVHEVSGPESRQENSSWSAPAAPGACCRHAASAAACSGTRLRLRVRMQAMTRAARAGRHLWLRSDRQLHVPGHKARPQERCRRPLAVGPVGIGRPAGGPPAQDALVLAYRCLHACILVLDGFAQRVGDLCWMRQLLSC